VYVFENVVSNQTTIRFFRGGAGGLVGLNPLVWLLTHSFYVKLKGMPAARKQLGHDLP
jgi:hypothetical protein